MRISRDDQVLSVAASSKAVSRFLQLRRIRTSARGVRHGEREPDRVVGRRGCAAATCSLSSGTTWNVASYVHGGLLISSLQLSGGPDCTQLELNIKLAHCNRGVTARALAPKSNKNANFPHGRASIRLEIPIGFRNDRDRDLLKPRATTRALPSNP